MLKQKFLIDFGSKFGIYLLTAITGIVVARIAGPEVVGTIAYATAYVSVFSFITGLFGSAYIKLVAEGQNEADCLATYIRLYGISIIIFFVVVLGFYSFQKFIVNYDFENREVEIVIIITLITITINNFYLFSQTVFIAKTEQAKANIPTLLKSLLYNILRIVVVLIGMGAIALASVNLISALLIIPLIVYLFKRRSIGKYNRYLVKKFFSISTPLFLIVLGGTLMLYSDKLILGHFANTEQIGYYTAAYSIAGMLVLLGNTAGTVFFPLFSTLFAENNINQIKQKINQFEKFVFIFALPLILTISLFSHTIIIILLGERYEPSVPILSLLVFSSFFTIWGMPYGNLLSALGLFWLSARINIMKFIIFIFTLIVFIHPNILDLSILALALTQVVINIFLFIAFYYFSWKKIKVQFIKEQLKYVIFWTVIYILTYFLLTPRITTLSLNVQFFIVFPLFLIMIYILEYMTGLMKRSDLQLLYQLLNPKTSLRYVREEFNGHSHNESPPRI